MLSGSKDHPVDEAYWASLLHEGEHTKTVFVHDEYPVAHQVHSNGNHSETAENVSNDSHHDWQEIQQLAAHDEVVELKVVGYNRGGLLVEWHSLRGFVPASQLLNFPVTRNNDVRRDALIDRIGQHLLLRVIELDIEKNRLILSERAAEVASGKRTQILGQLKTGDIVTGHITNLCDFGAFVDLGGIEGLIHISELSWGRVAHPADLLQGGQTLNVYVMDVDRDSTRIALSLKRLHADPWKTVQERYKIGQVVEGNITHVVDFGAFACIEDGLEGLIHISELAEGNFLHPRNVVIEGDHIRARILSIDGHGRRLGLSLRLV